MLENQRDILSIYTMEYYSTIKKNEILPFATAWVELDSIMLSEINQSEKEIPYDFTHVEFKK